MTGKRADLGFGAALEDLSGFAPAAPGDRPRPAKEAVAEAAGAAGFRSREPAAVVAPAPVQSPGPSPVPSPLPLPPLRRRRTGRNVQFNLKATAETIDAFCRIADTQGWGLGETLERAIALMEREGWAQAVPGNPR